MSAQPAEKLTSGRRRSGVFPSVPKRLQEAVDTLKVKEKTFENSETAFLQGETALRNCQSELRALESDEARALVALGDVEAQAQDTQVAREQLDSLRARQELARKEQERLAKDQAARRRMVELAQSDMNKARQDYQSLKGVFEQEALREHEKKELPKLQKHLIEYVVMRKALGGSYSPHQLRWWHAQIMTNIPFNTVDFQSYPVAAAFEDYIRGTE